MADERILFSGDNILGGTTCVFDNYELYMKSLGRLRELSRRDGKVGICPGHGEFIEDGLERIEFYIQHRQQREDQILAHLSKSNFQKTISQKSENNLKLILSPNIFE